jgi:hypothetical protein
VGRHAGLSRDSEVAGWYVAAGTMENPDGVRTNGLSAARSIVSDGWRRLLPTIEAGDAFSCRGVPRRQDLRPPRLRVGEIRAAECGNKNMRCSRVAGRRIDLRNGVAGEIHE